ncbi:hypothetical protein [Sulfitobacter sp. G21635-S1]|uniref:hypothetical protein n=1 Tax=Rhodobacterales TaxID=204455 RepID=UPI0022AF4FA1|nr:hypothetical protein [Sulfitobacter sp. G21635-S1]MCZ4258695.1 hypothetical protein [Sulfitobacter sp. G21635-S1]
MNAITEQVLTERIQEQEQTIAHLKQKLRDYEECSADSVVRRLRLHGTILIHVAGDLPKYQAAVRGEGLAGVGEDLISQTWDLENAPFPDDVKAAVREACNNGMSRW